jgi:6-phosphofructokinase 1
VDERGFPRFGGISAILGPEIERRTGFETRVTVLGHVQRGGTPVANDRILATRFGIAAVDTAARGDWGTMVASRGSEITTVPLKEAIAEVRRVPEALYRMAAVFFE